MLKKTVLALLLLMIMVAGTAFAGDISVYVDNTKVSFPDQKPYIDKNARTLVPIRFIAEEMGAEVGWDGKINLVTIEDKDVTINLTIGEKRAEVNGAWKEFDTQAALFNSRTMVPLRFISETLGAEVGWDGKQNRVDIWTKGPGNPAVTPYIGAKPTKTGDWIVSGKPATKRWDNPMIRYITIADLPAELNTLKIMDINIDEKYVKVTFFDKNGYRSAPNMYLAEGNDITRIRNYKDIVPIDGQKYIQKYAIRESYDTHPDVGKLSTECDIMKVTHFVFDGRLNGQTRLLAVENPKFGGK
jgi:hypothetical protein